MPIDCDYSLNIVCYDSSGNTKCVIPYKLRAFSDGETKYTANKIYDDMLKEGNDEQLTENLAMNMSRTLICLLPHFAVRNVPDLATIIYIAKMCKMFDSNSNRIIKALTNLYDFFERNNIDYCNGTICKEFEDAKSENINYIDKMDDGSWYVRNPDIGESLELFENSYECQEIESFIRNFNIQKTSMYDATEKAYTDAPHSTFSDDEIILHSKLSEVNAIQDKLNDAEEKYYVNNEKEEHLQEYTKYVKEIEELLKNFKTNLSEEIYAKLEPLLTLNEDEDTKNMTIDQKFFLFVVEWIRYSMCIMPEQKYCKDCDYNMLLRKFTIVTLTEYKKMLEFIQQNKFASFKIVRVNEECDKEEYAGDECCDDGDDESEERGDD